jgi:hypothetical protein
MITTLTILPGPMLRAGFMLCWFSTLKMEVMHSSETLVHSGLHGNIRNYGG